MYVCMYVFIKLHITTQSGPVILVILCHSHVCMYVCMYVCIYVCMYLCIYVSMYVCMYVCSISIKLPITAQSGPVTSVILCPLALILSRGDHDTCYENL